MKHTVTMAEQIARFDAARKAGERSPENAIEARHERYEQAQALGRVVLFDRACPYDPEGTLFAMLVASACGHLVRVPVTTSETTAIAGFARAEGVIL